LTPIDLSETLSRFIVQSNWIKPSDNSVRYTAFMPNPNNGETSVFRINGITDKDIWRIGCEEVAKKLSKTLYGRADIIANAVLSEKLSVIPKEPPERHANITDWPEERSHQKLTAMELSAEAQLYLK